MLIRLCENLCQSAFPEVDLFQGTTYTENNIFFLLGVFTLEVSIQQNLNIHITEVQI